MRRGPRCRGSGSRRGVCERFWPQPKRIEAIKEIWTKETAEYHGEFVNFPTMQTWPKPAQKPHPPIIVGGAFPHAARRAIRYGDGWVPIAGRTSYGDVNEYLPKFKQMVAKAGRSPDALPIALFGGTEDTNLLKRYRDMGVARVVTTLPPEPAEKTSAVLDRWAELIRTTNA